MTAAKLADASRRRSAPAAVSAPARQREATAWLPLGGKLLPMRFAACAAAALAAALLAAPSAAHGDAGSFEFDPTGRRAIEIARVPAADMTRERLEAAIVAGELLVIEGGAADWEAMRVWNMSWFEARFPDEPVEFRHIDAHVPGVFEQHQHLTLGNVRRTANALKPRRPWYAGWGNQHEHISREVFQPFMRPLPSWWPADYDEQGFLTEWLYFGTKASGVPWHVDPQCHPKVQILVEGAKRWHLVKWWEDAEERRVYTTLLRKGDVLIFYPQMLHHTQVLTKESSAYTSYFSSPRDTPFIRRLIEACEATPDMGRQFAKCYAPGATLAGIKATCERCAKPPGSDPLRPHMCDAPAGRQMCADWAAGRVREDELPWKLGAADRGNQRKRASKFGKPGRVTFSEPTRDTKRVFAGGPGEEL